MVTVPNSLRVWVVWNRESKWPDSRLLVPRGNVQRSIVNLLIDFVLVEKVEIGEIIATISVTFDPRDGPSAKLDGNVSARTD